MMKRRNKRARGAATATAAVAVLGVQLGGEAVQSVVDAESCSAVETNLCQPEPVTQSDVRDPELERAAIERIRIEARPAGHESLLPPSANMTMSGNAPEARMGGLDTTGMLPGTPLPLRAPSVSAVV